MYIQYYIYYTEAIYISICTLTLVIMYKKINIQTELTNVT